MRAPDDELLSFDKASEAVDDLLHDPQDDLGQLGIALSSAMPSVPPGFAGPHGHPDPTQPSSAPTLPWLLTPVPKVAAAGINHGTMTPEQTPRKGRLGSTARRGGKSLTTDSGAPKGAPSLSSQTQPLAVQDDENFPPLATQARKQQSSSPAIPTVPTPKGTPAPKRSSDKGKVPEKVSQLNLEKSRGQQKLDKERALEGARASTDGKQPQQKQPADRSKATMKTSELSFQNMPEDMSSNQAVASHSSRKPGSAGDEGLNAPTPRSEDSTRPQGSTDEVVFPPLPTPSGSGAASPAPRVAPKSLRLVSPVKTDTSTLPSLVQSLASRVVSASQGPDTAASDMASDTASLVSASVSASRAGSPPPNRIGSAAVRTSTKSSQRKERKKAFQEETKVISERPKEEPKPHDAIVVRKKKEKKEKPTRASAPPSQDEPLADAAIQDGPVTESTSKEGASSKESDGADLKDKLLPSRKGASSRKGKGKGKGKEKGKERETREVAQPQPTPPAADAEPNSTAQADEAERSRFSPAGVFAGLANLFKGEDLALFKPVPSGNQRQEHNSGAKNGAYCKDCACKCAEIREEDLAALRAGKPVRKQFHMDGGRMLITPNGDSIRGLSPNEEDAFLQLQTAIALSAEHPGAFVAPRHHPGSGAFSLIKGRAVPNGRPNIFPLTCHPSSPDPVGKMQREEALSYINQYVLPRLNLGASNMGFPNAASPARDSAAASLNSLAPYFYGPDAAAGVGIYSAPDGARAMRDFAASGGSQSEEPGKIPGTNGVSSMPLMSVEDAESALFAARRETEKLERGLNAVIKRNRRLVLGGS
ncbi:hypothetical protein RJ55_03769 [Drechmeria coniospora]|nr:hypothetical protein RJ55_03769 [Drechmeria coniospora]